VDTLVFAAQRIVYWLSQKRQRQVAVGDHRIGEDREPWYFEAPYVLLWQGAWPVGTYSAWPNQKRKPDEPVWYLPRKTDVIDLTGREHISQGPPQDFAYTPE
jgi:hypothetical protein